jgi:hypothetical protein
VGTVIHSIQQDKVDRKQRWERSRRAALLDQYRALQAEGISQRRAAKILHIPRTTLQAWHVWQERLDACPQVVAFFGLDHGVGHSLLLLYDAKAHGGQNSNYFNSLGHSYSKTSVSLSKIIAKYTLFITI